MKKSERKQNNIAYIDGQNLHLGTIDHEYDSSWVFDLQKFKIHLKDKHNVVKAYYYVGYKINKNQSLYKKIEEAGFILMFREHDENMKGQKKGNVDSDIIFDIMKRLYYDPEPFNKIILVSGDGDYYKLVNHLIEVDRLEKILFPNRGHSSLYNKLDNKYKFNLTLAKKQLEYIR